VVKGLKASVFFFIIYVLYSIRQLGHLAGPLLKLEDSGVAVRELGL
jgi:hypothetical protein